ncbi:MAG: hypothetical protein KGL35_02445, partial [Bradyrhizobium sp.]|nr:hypothetical protein [Bradyrhizobium sp.]
MSEQQAKHTPGPWPTTQRLDAALGGAVIPVISEWHPAEKKAFERAVCAGKLMKWRGHWHPVPGAHWGIGPLKTCY